MWKDDAIDVMKSCDNADDVRRIAQKVCRNNCHVVNYNYHCPRCKLSKYASKRIKELNGGGQDADHTR